jgi:hypothetical protein
LGNFSLQAGLHTKGGGDSSEDSDQDLQYFAPNSFFHSKLVFLRLDG